MNTFLHDVARSLFEEYGADNLSRMQVVFASRRAAIYFSDELKKFCDKSPRLMTIDKWILSYEDSEVKYPSKFLLTAKLYTIYKKYYTETSLDDFFSFGEMILSDFDMIDRYLVDAEAIYTNVADIKELDSSLAVEDESYEAAKQFWSNFNSNDAERSAEQEFKRVWDRLFDIYTQYNELLDGEGISYSGKSYRRVAEKFLSGENTDNRKIVFVGLNALSRSEKAIFKSLSNADFIWDYDPKWLVTKNNFIEAGYFIKDNLVEFGQAPYFKSEIRESMDVEIRAFQSPSDILQAKITTELLSQQPTGKTTAVILTDENLLMPLLHSIPPEVGELNISMGYPLLLSQAGRLLNSLIALHTNRRNKGAEAFLKRADIQNLIYNNYTYCQELEDFLLSSIENYILIDDLAAAIPQLTKFWNIKPLHFYLIDCFESIEVEDEKDKLFVSSVLEVLGSVTEVMSVFDGELSDKLYLKVLSQAVREKRIDFEGVSGSGLQIMGILESRSLDFDRVILLSLTDDNFPSSKPDNSYIPPLLLQGFGMPSIVEKSAIWSYYFYRLLQRSENVSLVYPNVADGLSTGEASRYILQMKYDNRFNIKDVEVKLPSVTANLSNVITIAKDDETVEKLRNRQYSASAINQYLHCPLSFYFSKIEKLDSGIEVADNVISALEIGNIVHHSLKEIYATNSQNSPQQIIDAEINSTIPYKQDSEQSKIVISEINSMITNVLNYDNANKITSGFARIESVEQTYRAKVGDFNLYSEIDRIDRLMDGSVRIIDYKTGRVGNPSTDTKGVNFPSISDLFVPCADVHYKEVAQLMIYAYIFRQNQNVDIIPAIYALRRMNQRGYNPQLIKAKVPVGKLSTEDYKEIEESLAALLSEISSNEKPFYQTPNADDCKYCEFAKICGR